MSLTTALPRHPDRLTKLGFWLVMSLAGAVIVEIGTVLAGGWGATGLVGGAAFVVLALIGAAWPGLNWFAYRAWNRLAREFAGLGRSALIWTCYNTVFRLAGRVGSGLRLERPEHGSLWVPRDRLPAAAYASQDCRSMRVTRGGFWTMAFWAARPGNLWAVALIPYLWLLRTLTARRTAEAPPDIYTLY